jgi:hypothetical protein
MPANRGRSRRIARWSRRRSAARLDQMNRGPLTARPSSRSSAGARSARRRSFSRDRGGNHLGHIYQRGFPMAESDESALINYPRSRLPAKRLVYRPNRFVAWRSRRKKSLQSLQSPPPAPAGTGGFLPVSGRPASIASESLQSLGPSDCPIASGEAIDETTGVFRPNFGLLPTVNSSDAAAPDGPRTRCNRSRCPQDRQATRPLCRRR